MRGFHTAALVALVALALCEGGAADTNTPLTRGARDVNTESARSSLNITKTAARPRAQAQETVDVPANITARVAARDGGTDGGSSSVDAGRTINLARNPVCPNDVKPLVCCLEACQAALLTCIDDIFEVCPATDNKTPFECLLEFKCCTLDTCIICDPGECLCDGTVCSGVEVCCNDNCVPAGTCCDGTVCSDVEVCCGGTSCKPSQDCCDGVSCRYGKKCCAGKCIYNTKCCDDEDCLENQYCCENDNKCTNKNKCCDGADTCYAKDTAGGLDCCWIEENDRNSFAQGPCGDPTSDPATSFNNWGWTNGPYDLTGASFIQSLGVYCGAGKCDTGKGFERGNFDFTWDGTTFEARWTATMPDPTAGWELHLGCGTTGVYAKNKRNKFTVAPGQYEFRGTGTETLKLTSADFDFSSCDELYVIAHFCSTNPVAD